MQKKIVIVGAGLAGMYAALTVAKEGHQALLVSMMPSERSQSTMAAGGMNAALNVKNDGDSVTQHAKDTIEASVHLANEVAVQNLVEAAPEMVRELAEMGVLFNRNEAGEIDTRPFGGQSKIRTVYASSSTGKQMVSGLIQAVRKQEVAGLITRYAQHSFVRLVQGESGEAIGIIALHNQTGQVDVINGNAVIFASGGFNGIMGNTTGSVNNTGTVTGSLLKSGAALANLEFVQYHPTTVFINNKRLLISEAARGEGGRLFALRNGERWYFMEEWFPEKGALMPRDVVSKSIYRALRSIPHGEDHVYLDLTFLPNEVIEKKLDDFVMICNQYLRLDPRKDVIPVYPGIHYFMGGLWVDVHHRTNLSGVYAAGEAACQYHGANRLGGNSLLGALVGGKIAAETCIQDEQPNHPKVVIEFYNKKALDKVGTEVVELKQRTKHLPLPNLIQQMQAIMDGCLGIERCEEDILEGIRRLDHFYETIIQNNYDPTTSVYRNLTIDDRLLLCRAVLSSALERKESRGSHMRSDYPERNDYEYQRITRARCDDGREITIDFVQI